MVKTRQETIDWIKAALKRQKDFQREVREQYARQKLATAV